MIDIFLNGASNVDADGTLKYNYVFGESQKSLSIALLLITIISVPLLLCFRPFWVKCTSKGHHGAHVEVHTGSVQYDKIPEGKGITRNERYEQIVEILEKENQPAENHEFGEVFIH